MRDSGLMLAVIPARGGSKRLPRKNVLLLGGRPLIAWTIAAARASGVFDAILVSTDDEETAGIARDAGALVPWLRPTDLASDTARSADVLRHALRWYEGARGSVDAVVLLQPTSPFRSVRSIRAAVGQYLEQPTHKSVVSVSPASPHPAWCFTLEGTQLTPFAGWDLLERRSQDLPASYALNGAIYVFPAEHVRSDRALLGPGLQAFLMDDPDEAHDIDTETDWRVATLIEQRLARGAL